MRLTAVSFFKTFTRALLKSTEKEVEVQAPWGKIAALTWGDPANPPIFLCHGRLDGCSSFRCLLQYLPTHYYYVTMDLPGNGRSSPLPRGARYTILDLLYSLATVLEHFAWEKYVFIGHSVGAHLGKYYNLFYPGLITRLVEIDPYRPAYPYGDPDLRTYYMRCYYQFYKDFRKNSGEEEMAPKYTYEEVRQKLIKTRGINQEVADDVLERCLVPAGDGLYRLTYDQRFKTLDYLPFSADRYRRMFMKSSTPTLAILASGSVARGWYSTDPYATDDAAWTNRNYRHVIVEGTHDVHLQNTAEVARHIVDFLEYGTVKSVSS